VRDWFASVEAAELYLSVLVVGEIRQGVERLRPRDPDQAAVFERWLAELQRDFGRRVLPVTVRIAEEWGRLNAADPLPAVDGLLAATAKVEGLTLVTRNVADVARTQLDVVNPFTPDGSGTDR
jgi:predicted nucleic acid-binding protein